MGRFPAIGVLLGVLAALAALPALALAAPGGDGTLSVRKATGTISVAARGTLLGHCDRCTVIITDPDPTDGRPPFVTPLSAVRTALSDTRTSYTGNDLRFRIVGGFFRVKVFGTGIDLSVVASGAVTLGDGTAGTYSVDGAAFAPVPDARTTLPLGG